MSSSPSASIPLRPGALSCALSLVLTTVGSGILSFPFAAASAGTQLFLALLLLLLGSSYFCSLVIGDFAWAHRARARNFEDVVVAVLGPRFYVLAAAQVILGLLGCVVGFLCIAGDLGAQASGWPRASVIFAVAAALLPAAGCARRVHEIIGASALGVAAVVAVVALLVARAVRSREAGSRR
jgi:amino acid permease